jgi:hypothetical protein
MFDCRKYCIVTVENNCLDTYMTASQSTITYFCVDFHKKRNEELVLPSVGSGFEVVKPTKYSA